ncbi:MAG: hypothetical protein KatS3mg121_0529 [Gammaproteobacteria bacterium]|nr:MAG: hypothetical protein KatS3mg121_0529 [Gammaproteobacteria bacterium]
MRCARPEGLALLLFAAAAAGAESAPPGAITPELRRLVDEALAAGGSFEDRFEGEVWLADMAGRLARFVPDEAERIRILRAVHYEARRAGLPPEMVLAVIEVESRFDRFAISRVGALGLMQVMPFWLEVLERPQANLFDITTNLRIGCTILKHYLDRENGDWRRALARYNGSVGRRHYPDKVFGALSRRWFRR